MKARTVIKWAIGVIALLAVVALAGVVDGSPDAFPANAQAATCRIRDALGLGRETRDRPANPLAQNRHYELQTA